MGAGAAAGGTTGAGTGTCAKLVATLNARLAQRAKFLIISSHPAAALREEDHSLAAAPSSKTPTKHYRPHRQSPKPQEARHQAAAAWPSTLVATKALPEFALAVAPEEWPAAES